MNFFDDLTYIYLLGDFLCYTAIRNGNLKKIIFYYIKGKISLYIV